VSASQEFFGAWLTVWDVLPILLFGAITTVEVTIGGFLLATLIGLTLAILQRLNWRPLNIAIATYVDVFRAVPVLTQLFIIYFGLTEVGIRLDPIPSAIIGFGINGGAYLTEVFRAGIESVHQGQMEAAQMLGMMRLPALRIVILPQAMRVVLPPLGNFAIGLLKDTALASAVAAPELMFRARTLVDKTFLATQIFVTAAAIYLILSLPLGYLTRRAEARLSRGRH
jgi:polar amino acid transport system permease protein/cystine transport system permease protein